MVEAISSSTVWRVLRADAIRPWLHRMWIFPRDPNFAAKAARALDLYARVFEGEALGDDDYVVCADELCEASHNSRLSHFWAVPSTPESGWSRCGGSWWS